MTPTLTLYVHSSEGNGRCISELPLTKDGLDKAYKLLDKWKARNAWIWKTDRRFTASEIEQALLYAKHKARRTNVRRLK